MYCCSCSLSTLLVTENYIPGSVKCNRLFKYLEYGVPFLKKTNKLFLFLKKIYFWIDINVHELNRNRWYHGKWVWFYDVGEIKIHSGKKSWRKKK